MFQREDTALGGWSACSLQAPPTWGLLSSREPPALGGAYHQPFPAWGVRPGLRCLKDTTSAWRHWSAGQPSIARRPGCIRGSQRGGVLRQEISKKEAKLRANHPHIGQSSACFGFRPECELDPWGDSWKRNAGNACEAVCRLRWTANEMGVSVSEWSPLQRRRTRLKRIRAKSPPGLRVRARPAGEPSRPSRKLALRGSVVRRSRVSRARGRPHGQRPRNTAR